MSNELLDVTPLSFGKHKGLTPDEVAVDNPGYIVWMYENIHPKRCSEELYKTCRQDIEEQKQYQDSALEGYPN